MKTLETKPPQKITVLHGYVTEGQLCRMVDRSPLTLALWRNKRGLPYVVIPGDGRDTIRYVLKDVRAWAKRNGVKIKVA